MPLYLFKQKTQTIMDKQWIVGFNTLSCEYMPVLEYVLSNTTKIFPDYTACYEHCVALNKRSDAAWEDVKHKMN